MESKQEFLTEQEAQEAGINEYLALCLTSKKGKKKLRDSLSTEQIQVILCKYLEKQINEQSSNRDHWQKMYDEAKKRIDLSEEGKKHYTTMRALIESNTSFYKHYIKLVEQLDWSKADPYLLVYYSELIAAEFEQALSESLAIHAWNNAQTSMTITHALYTGYADLLEFEDSGKRSSQSLFLVHFMNMDKRYKKFCSKNPSGSGLLPPLPFLKYDNFCRTLINQERFETIVSRVSVLPGIFQKILNAHDWRALGLGFYEYYLSENIRFYSEGGYADLLKDVELHEDVLATFWQAYYEMYESLFK